MARHDESEVVFVVGDDAHVIFCPCAAAQTQGQNDVREDEIFVEVEEAVHLAHNQDAGVFDFFYEQLFG